MVIYIYLLLYRVREFVIELKSVSVCLLYTRSGLDMDRGEA